MDKCSMMVVIDLGLSCALTAPSMSGVTLLTQILLVTFISSIVVAFSLRSNRQAIIKFVGGLPT